MVAQHATEEDMEYAWKVIKELSTELLDKEMEAIRERNAEQSDEVFALVDRRKKDDLATKRSFFVRMVSDPKIYNPKIASASPVSRRHTHVSSLDESVDQIVESNTSDENDEIATPTSASWISWPLAFLFQGVFDENAGSNDVPVRFRHLAAKVHFKTKRDNMRKSPSPDDVQNEDEGSNASSH